MKTLYAYLNEKGQDLVEYTLILSFCAVLAAGFTSDSFHSTIKAIFDKGLFNDVTTHMSAGDYADAYKAFSEDSRRALANIGYDYGRYYLDSSGKDPVPNELRLATDKKALENIANFFLGMDYATVDVENNYDPYTQTYMQDTNKHTTANITFENKEKTKAYDIIHWMMGDYGLDANGNPVGDYQEPLDFAYNGTKSSKRYFFSNEMIDPDGTTSGNTVKRNIRVSFMLNSSGTEVIGVQVKAQRNGEDIDALKVTVEK